MKKCHQVGFGFDSHVFARTGTCKLGGISLRGAPSLKGHSDGDALLHALIDSLCGAAGLGDIGDWFPDTDKKNKGISSRVMLGQIYKKVLKKGLRPVHVDLTVLADKPKISPSKGKIQSALSGMLKIPRSAVNIKAKSQEGLCFFRSPGGIAVWSVVTLSQSS